MCSTSILSDLQNIRENPKRILIYSDFDSARQQASNEVYFSLVMLTAGKAATIVRTVRDNNGYEAYRFLRQRFEPENYGKHLTSLTQILKFDFGSNLSEFLDKLIEWEGLIDKYEQETLETISKNLLCAIVVEKAPEAIRMHLLVQCGEKPDWLKLCQTVHDYCYAVIPGPIAMDVGAITKGWRKGKSKHKYESHGDGGKGKKGKKGKQAKNSGKSNGHEHFDGHCHVLWNMVTPAERLLVSQKKKDTKSTMFLKMDRQHHAQHISRHPLHQPAHFHRRHRRTVRSSTAVLRRTKTAGYSEWKVKRVRSRIILLVQMNFLTTAEMARE